MPKPLWPVCVALILAAVAVALFRPTESVSAAPPEEYKFAAHNALRVTRKQGEAFYLSSTAAVRIGDRLFIAGQRVGEDMKVFIPVSDIDLIEELTSVEEMKKRYRIDALDPKRPVVAPGTTEKK